MNGTLEPGTRISDYAARGQSIWGSCRAQGCTRRVTINPEALCKEGFGSLAMTRVKPMWRCNRLDGCELVFYDEQPAVRLRLEHLMGRANVRILVKCRTGGCKFVRTYLVESIIKGLVDRHQGDDRTEIDSLPSKLKSPCPLCKKASWEASILWADTETMGWRAAGGSYFERYESR